jgi:hypothetical protein
VERVEVASELLARASGWVLLGSVLAAAAGGFSSRLAEGLAAFGLLGLVSAAPLRMVVLVGRFWLEEEYTLAGLAALLLLMLGAVAAWHL